LTDATIDGFDIGDW